MTTFTLISNIILSPYNLYKTIRGIAKIKKETLINYQQMFEEAQKRIHDLEEEKLLLESRHEEHLKQVEHQNAANLVEYDKTYKISINNLQDEKKEREQHLQGVTLEVETLIVQHKQDIANIQSLKEDIKEMNASLEITNLEKKKLEEETLILNDRLAGQANITERQYQQYIEKHKYLNPKEAQQLRKDTDKTTRLNKVLEDSIKVLKDEINKGYTKDVDISKKLIAYLTDMKTINETIESLNNNLHQIVKDKIDATTKIQEQTHEISLLGIIDKKSSLNHKDIQQLQERIEKVNQSEKTIVYYKSILDKEMEKESMISSKLKDQRILYHKRIELIKDQIHQWIEDKSAYYVANNIPFEDNKKGANDLQKYIEELKKMGKFHGIADKEKETYSYQEFKNYINERDYNVNSRNTPQSTIGRFNEERALVVANLKNSLSLANYKKKVTLEMKEEYLKILANPDVTPPTQQAMNTRMLQSLTVPVRSTSMTHKNTGPLPYKPLINTQRNTGTFYEKNDTTILD